MAIVLLEENSVGEGHVSYWRKQKMLSLAPIVTNGLDGDRKMKISQSRKRICKVAQEGEKTVVLSLQNAYFPCF